MLYKFLSHDEMCLRSHLFRICLLLDFLHVKFSDDKSVTCFVAGTRLNMALRMVYYEVC